MADSRGSWNDGGSNSSSIDFDLTYKIEYVGDLSCESEGDDEAEAMREAMNEGSGLEIFEGNSGRRAT